MGRSGNMKPMRGNIVGGWDCPCCSSWNGSRAEEKRELLNEAREGIECYKQDNTDLWNDEWSQKYLQSKEKDKK